MTAGDEYDFIMATLISDGDTSQWVATVPMTGYSNKVTVTKNSDGYHITYYSVPDLKVTDFKIVSDPVYLNMPVKFEATFANGSDTELTRNYSGEFFDSDGTKWFTMENFSVTLAAGETATVEWSSVEWYKEKDAGDLSASSEFTLKLYDNWQGKYVDVPELTVSVEPTPSKPEVDANLTIENAREENGVFVVEGNEVEASITLTVKKGLFNKPVLLEVQTKMADGKYYTVQHKRFDAIPYLSEGETGTFEMSMTIEDASNNQEYRLVATGSGIENVNPVLVKFMIDDSGVENNVADMPANYIVYNLQGVLVLETHDSGRLQALPSGIYIVNGAKFFKP